MAKIHGLLDVGRRGMAVSQSALNTTSHNIANKSTEGYSRQRVETQATTPVGDGNKRVGTGSRLSAINRTNNPWLEKNIPRTYRNRTSHYVCPTSERKTTGYRSCST